MPLEEEPTPTAENADREQTNTANRPCSLEQPVAGPSNSSQHQGFCSYCQVVYNSVEQHIQSTRHREVVVRTARTNLSSGSLLERFLQDVLHHHPHGYNDTRPTHADLPCLSKLPVPREVLSEVHCRSEDDGLSVGTREETLSSAEESCHMVQAEPTTTCSMSQEQANTSVNVPMKTIVQTGLKTVQIKVEPPVPERCSPTQGFLHRTNIKSGTDKQHTSQMLAQTVTSQIQHSQQPCSPQTSGSPKIQHRKAHRKTNRLREDDDSSPGTPTSPVTKCATSKPQHRGLQLARTVVPTPCKGPHRKRTFSENSDQIHEVIEEVIERHCYGRSPKPNQEDESVFHLSLQSSESKDSDEWDNTFQASLPKNTTEDDRLARLMQVHINLEDQEYKAQLDTALNNVLESDKMEPVDGKEYEADEIIPNLPHIPPSFVGKTWAQVRYEDDLKIDCLVKEFRQGRFRCYFDSESLANFGSHNRKDKDQQNHGVNEADFVCKDVLPLIEHHEEDLPVYRKSRPRLYRIASRCQVVKVSHGTQTANLNCPVVRRKPIPESATLLSTCETQKDPSPERTPDMKTRMCALKLPASYCKIMSPLQPKTVVYVLSFPDGGQGSFKPTPVKRVGKKRKSSDEECAIKYKYKKTPLKYYDPLTNRILKTSPRGMPSTPTFKSLSHVRQLFRSLSPDINKELHGSAQGRSPRGSRKSRGEGSMADHCASTSGSWLDNGGPSEPGSSVSSRKALFSRSSISSSSRFLLGQIRSSASHTSSSSRAKEPSGTDSSLKVPGTKLKSHHTPTHLVQPAGRRRKQGQRLTEKPLTPAKKPSSPPYRTKRKSPKARAKSRNVLQRKVSTRVASGCRASTRNKIPTRASRRR